MKKITNTKVHSSITKNMEEGNWLTKRRIVFIVASLNRTKKTVKEFILLAKENTKDFSKKENLMGLVS